MAITIKAALPIKYCRECGRKCTYTQFRHHFERTTGAPVNYTRERCSWFWRWAFAGHTDNTYDETNNHLRWYEL